MSTQNREGKKTYYWSLEREGKEGKQSPWVGKSVGEQQDVEVNVGKMRRKRGGKGGPELGNGPRH